MLSRFDAGLSWFSPAVCDGGAPVAADHINRDRFSASGSVVGTLLNIIVSSVLIQEAAKGAIFHRDEKEWLSTVC